MTTREKIIKIKRLPANSRINVSCDTRVEPGTVLAEYFDPFPRQYFLSTFSSIPNGLPYGYRAEWHIEKGSQIEFNSPIVTFHLEDPSLIKLRRPAKEIEYKSPIDGHVTDIYAASGNILMLENLDYKDDEVLLDLDNPARKKGYGLRRLLKCETGDFVEKGQSVLSIMSKELNLHTAAPIAGRVTNIDFKNWNLTISRKFTNVEIYSGIFGIVTEVSENGIRIEGYGSVFHGVCGFGGESFGRLRFICSSGQDKISPGDITEKDKGNILVGGGSLSQECLEKCRDVGISGIITGGIDHMDLCEFLGMEVSAASTGFEEVPFTIIVTERFGVSPINPEIINHLKNAENRFVYLNGKTQIRAGVVRPEIILMENASNPL